MLSASYKDHIKKTLLLAYPVCISQFGHIMVGVADTAMVGMIGTREQAAVALANSLFFLILVFSIGLSMGITPPVAAADAQNDIEKKSQLIRHGLFLNFISSIVLFVVLYCMTPLLRHMDQEADVVESAIPFFNVMIFSLIPLSFFFTFKQFTEGMSDTKMAMIVTILSNVLNVILNYVLMFGKCGIAPMGLMGSAWATFISRVVMAVWMFFYIYFSPKYKVYWKKLFPLNIKLDVSKKILGIGIPSGLQWVFEVGAFSVAALMAGWMGKTQQAAHQVALSLAAITYMVASGISAAATVRVGNFHGLKDKDGVKKAGITAYGIVIGFMSCSALMFIVLSSILPQLFSKDEQVIQLASSLLIIAAFFQLFDGTQVVGLGILRGLNDTVISTVVTLVAYWIIAVPISYCFAFKLNYGIQGIWWGLSIGLIVVAVFLYWRFKYLISHYLM